MRKKIGKKWETRHEKHWKTMKHPAPSGLQWPTGYLRDTYGTTDKQQRPAVFRSIDRIHLRHTVRIRSPHFQTLEESLEVWTAFLFGDGETTSKWCFFFVFQGNRIFECSEMGWNVDPGCVEIHSLEVHHRERNRHEIEHYVLQFKIKYGSYGCYLIVALPPFLTHTKLANVCAQIFLTVPATGSLRRWTLFWWSNIHSFPQFSKDWGSRWNQRQIQI